MICPYCKKKEASERPLWPFCTKRCKDADLGAWAKEEYRVAGKAVDIYTTEESLEEDQFNEEE